MGAYQNIRLNTVPYVIWMWNSFKFSSFIRMIFTTCYMGTVNSSPETRDRAQRLAEQIGTNHISIGVDEAVSANLAIFAQVSICSSIMIVYKLPRAGNRN